MLFHPNMTGSVEVGWHDTGHDSASPPFCYGTDHSHHSPTLSSLIGVNCLCILWNETSLRRCKVFCAYKKSSIQLQIKFYGLWFFGYFMFL